MSAGLHDVSVPEGVVGYYEAPLPEKADCTVEVIDIPSFVGIDEDEIKFIVVPLLHYLQRIPYVQAHLVGVWRHGYVLKDEVLQFIVHFNSVDGRTGLQPFSDAEGGVSGECAEFKHSFRGSHSGEHLQYPTLYVSGAHAPVDHP